MFNHPRQELSLHSAADPRSTRTGGDITKSFFSTIERQVHQRARRRRYGNEQYRHSYGYWMSNGHRLNLNNRSLSKPYRPSRVEITMFVEGFEEKNIGV